MAVQLYVGSRRGRNRNWGILFQGHKKTIALHGTKIIPAMDATEIDELQKLQMLCPRYGLTSYVAYQAWDRMIPSMNKMCLTAEPQGL